MITPAYSLTSTERILPRMALDFTTGTLDPRVTVTRALNTATRVNSSGLIEVVNANLPRFDYSSISVGVCKGLLIEETRTNSCLHSQNPSDVSWETTNATKTSTNNSDPFGTNTALLLTANGTSTPHYIIPNRTTNVSYTSGASYTASCFVKPATASLIQITMSGSAFGTSQYANFSLTGDGSVTSAVGGTGAIWPFANGWYRIAFSVAATATIGTYPGALVFITSGTDGRTPTNTSTGSVYMIGWQTEPGAFATSYIPTTTTSLTRNADVVSMTGTNFSSWYSSSSAALAAVVIPSIATGTRPIWQLDDTTANEIIALRGNVANPELYIVDNGTPQAQLDAGTITANTQYGLCAAFTVNSCAASQNGATPVTTATATMPTVTQARIGSDGSNFLNGVVRTLRYWPQRILNAETQAFSK